MSPYMYHMYVPDNLMIHALLGALPNSINIMAWHKSNFVFWPSNLSPLFCKINISLHFSNVLSRISVLREELGTLLKS